VDVELKIAVLTAYFLVIIGIAAVTRLRLDSSSESYFLADRRLQGVILLATMAATNFSAFTVYGTSGAGYRDGYGFLPIMAFGTGFMALSFWVIGRRAWRLGREWGVITPPELIRRLYASPVLSTIVAVVMIVFTIPYISLQPMAAGYALEELVGLPYPFGCTLVTAVIVLYTFGGGMQAEAWVDLFQGTFMLALLVATLVIVSVNHGGFAAANQKVMALKPELFARPGALGSYTPGIWFSYLALWFFCDPMFPQLFQRFFAAHSEQAIARMMLFYPLVCTLVFLPPIAVGVLGHLSVPGLAGQQADRVLPLVMNALGGDIMAALVTAAGLAALMSTMDSQLLTLSAVFTRDILPRFRSPAASSGIPARLFTIGLGAAGLALAYHPPAIMLQIATETFTGLAVLFPTMVFGLYWKRVHPGPAGLSIVAGEALLAAFHLRWVSPGPFLPVVWVLSAAFGVYLTAHLALTLWKGGGLRLHLPKWAADPYALAFGGIFLLALDFWAWGETEPTVLGLPLWVWYSMLLSALQTATMVGLTRRDLRGSGIALL
jgi:SSS family solute:Na+ symporter